MVQAGLGRGRGYEQVRLAAASRAAGAVTQPVATVGPATPLIITMLGTPLSGKTTYLLTMYGTLSLGVGRQSLVADPNQDYELGEDWDRLCREGRLPPPTADEPREYRFTFTHDLAP